MYQQLCLLTLASCDVCSGQEGTPFDDEWKGAAAGIDGTSAILVGYTDGAWVNSSQDEERDFAAIELDADGATLWTYQVSSKRLLYVGCLSGQLGSRWIIQGSNRKLCDLANATWIFEANCFDIWVE